MGIQQNTKQSHLRKKNHSSISSSLVKMANPGNVAGGLKATINNPNVSEQAKANAEHRLETEEFPSVADEANQSKNPNNVVGGMKAAINNPNVSEEKKSELRSKLDDA